MLAAARVSAAMEVLDRALGGMSLDTALTAWGRSHRFAGSTDRAAIRDLVFDGWRCKRSYAALGGAETGRGLMLGRLRTLGQDEEREVFTGVGHAPAPVTAADLRCDPTGLAALDCPDWLGPRLQHSLGARFAPVLQAMQHRAPVFLRVNLARISRDAAMELLAADDIATAAHPLAETSLEVLTPTRKIMTTKAYLSGLLELQDVASQAVIGDIPLQAGQKVLDYCAGGGGKALALAARLPVQIWAHDADLSRMRDIPERAERAGATITIVADPAKQAPYDLVLVDAPCSGSGSWRRDPQGKWSLTEARLADLTSLQAQILDKAAPLTGQGGLLAYATCSLLAEENEVQMDQFLTRSPGWQHLSDRHLTPLDGGDGFYLSILRRVS